jgi:hypothetical protein
VHRTACSRHARAPYPQTSLTAAAALALALRVWLRAAPSASTKATP